MIPAGGGGWVEPEIIPITPEGILWTAIALLCISLGILILLIIVKEKNSFLQGFQSRFKIIKSCCVFDKKPKFEWGIRNGLIALPIVLFVAASGFLIYEYIKNTQHIFAASISALILAFASFAVSIKKYY